MVNFNSFSKTHWKEKLDNLNGYLKHNGVNLMHTRIVRAADDVLVFEGGRIALKYNATHGEVYVWGKNSRYSGSDVSVEELQTIRILVTHWYDKHIKSHDKGEIKDD